MELRSDMATATIHKNGGRLASLVIDGLEVMLTEGEKPTRWGSFPMIPWCPTGELEPVPLGPWDACFVGLAEDPVITWPGALALTVSSTFDHWVIFTKPEQALCVEPQSGPPNEFHLAPRLLAAGESLVGSMTFSWQTA